MQRREFLQLAGATIAAGFSTRAAAQTWPERTVKVILPYAPGGATDAIGRPWADKLSQAFGQQFVIENRGGAGGMIGAEAAAKYPPYVYTFFLTPNEPLSVVPTLRKTAYDPVKSFDPVGFTHKLYESASLRMTFRAQNRKQAESWQKQFRAKLTELVGGFPSTRKYCDA